MFDQKLFPGSIDEAVKKEIHSLIQIQAIRRLWAGDTTLWTNDTREAADFRAKLGWLELTEKLGPCMERAVQRAASLEGDGLEDIVFVAIGQSNLAAETVIRQPIAKLGKKFLLLDSIGP